jgi:GNAT superfamily N-acetyltransferase
MTARAYSLEPVETLSPAAMTGLRRIYEDGFPPHQRADFAAVTTARQEDELALALTGGGQPCGFAMLRPLDGTGWVFLRYFVVDRARRDQGLGGLLWQQLAGRLREAGFTLLVFDIEDPDEPACGPDQAQLRFRRLRFYQRQGASLLPVTGYRAPHVAPETSGWSPMLLMTAAPSGRQAPPGPGQARAIVEAVYRFRWELEPEHFPAFSLHAGDPARCPRDRSGIRRPGPGER